MLRYLLLMLLSSTALACPEALRYADPCNPVTIDLTDKGYSIYQDGDICTQPLLNDGVCPDYLVGGCAVIGECKFILQARNKEKPVVFTD